MPENEGRHRLLQHKDATTHHHELDGEQGPSADPVGETYAMFQDPFV